MENAVSLCAQRVLNNRVHYSDEISNRKLIISFAKVVDIIEEMEGLKIFKSFLFQFVSNGKRITKFITDIIIGHTSK